MSNESKILSLHEAEQALLAFMDCTRDAYDWHNTDSKQMEAKRRMQELRQQIEDHDDALRQQRDALLAMVDGFIAIYKSAKSAEKLDNDMKFLVSDASALITSIKGEQG